MLRMTSKRKKVYDVIEKSNKPINAEIIADILGDDNINLSTIYRAIEYFINNDLLLTFYFNNKTYYILNNEGKHYHYFICTNCLYMEKINCNMNPIINKLETENNFLITNHEMNVFGLCNSCNI